jgi:hypothetical protein
VSRAANVTVEGFLFPAEPSATIQLVCEVRPYSGSEFGSAKPTGVEGQATMTMTRLTSATTTGSASMPPRNRFHKVLRRQASAKPSDAGR